MRNSVFVTALLVLVLGCGSAWAADPDAAAYNWTGFYAGLNTGVAKNDSRYTIDPHESSVSGGFDNPAFTIGGQAGYNYQAGNFVYGLETDFNYNSTDDSAAGCQLVAACDLAVAETGARFATPGVKIGIFCTTPMIPLVRVVGRRRAMDMLLSGRFVSAEEALRFGLVNKVVPPEKLAEETRNWALELAQASPFVLGLGKHAFYSQVDLDEKSAYGYAKEVIAMNCMADDAFEGMSAFIDKRKPVWSNK